jgi:enoyl-CoA hydratase/carnithine racemase
MQKSKSADAMILLSRHDDVCVLTLNKPDSLNSLSLDAIKALLKQLRALAGLACRMSLSACAKRT